MRFTAITIENFKNVEHGELSFVNKRRPEGPSILALYGQNGSGKSALVDCMALFKALMYDGCVPDRFADYVTKGASCARIEYELETVEPFTPYCLIKYEVEIAPYIYEGPADDEPTEKRNALSNKEIVSSPGLVRAFLRPDGVKTGDTRMRILSETLSYSIPGETRMRPIFSTANTESFKPVSIKRNLIELGATEEGLSQLRNAFYNEGHSCLGMFCDDTAALFCGSNSNRPQEELFNSYLVSMLQHFALSGLFVVGTREAEALESGSMELFVDKDYMPEREVNPTRHLYPIDIEAVHLYFGSGSLRISTDAGNPLPLSDYMAEVVSYTLGGISELLSAIVPGMTLRLRRDGLRLSDGCIPSYVESCREGRSIPLSCESRGVQKLVSVAWLLVSVYNSTRVTAVIDELDSGIFEYLLGEILRIVSEEGQGQLIFTSHNLRPLEVLDKGYIAFTTSNPKQRYMRMKNVKATNNLRDFYYRSILLGGQGESIYEPSTNGEITLSFIKAGEGVVKASEKFDKSQKDDMEYLFGDRNVDDDETPHTATGDEGVSNA